MNSSKTEWWIQKDGKECPVCGRRINKKHRIAKAKFKCGYWTGIEIVYKDRMRTIHAKCFEGWMNGG